MRILFRFFFFNDYKLFGKKKKLGMYTFYLPTSAKCSILGQVPLAIRDSKCTVCI